MQTQFTLRSPDARYTYLDDVITSAIHAKTHSVTYKTDLARIAATLTDDFICEAASPFKFTNYSFSQLCSLAKVPTPYLLSLPNDLAANCLRHSLNQAPFKPYRLLTEDGTIRSFNSSRYQRVFDADIIAPLTDHATLNNFEPVRIYRSDRAFTAYFVDKTAPLYTDPNPRDTLYPGFYLRNSEVGASALHFQPFLFRAYCKNGMILDRQNAGVSISLRHIGSIRKQFQATLDTFLHNHTPALPFPADAISKAKDTPLPSSDDKEAVKRLLTPLNLTLPTYNKALARAQAEESEATTIWHLIQGITSLARTAPHAEDTITLERTAGHILETV